MPEAFAGHIGTGSVDVYTVPPGYELVLDLLTFDLVTDATASVHSAMVTFTDATLSAITARLWDWNEGGPSMTLHYTYGRGLKPFNCTVTDGMAIEHPLPDTLLNPDTVITVDAVNVALSVIAGDQVRNVVLYGTLTSLVDVDQGPTTQLVPGLLPGAAIA